MARLGLADLVFGTVLLLAVLTMLAFARRRGAAPRRLLVLGLFGGYLTVLAVIILCPLPGAAPPPAFEGAPSTPLLQVGTTLDLRGLLSSGLRDQNLQNLLLGVPFGLLLPLVVRRVGSWLFLAAGLLLGVGLEAMQALVCLLAGWAYRSVDINDLLANDAGALLGLLLFALVNWRFRVGPGPSGRAAAVGVPIALGLAAVAVIAGPREAFEPGRDCEVTPATAIEIEEYSVFADHDVVCLTHPQGFTALLLGDQTPSLDFPTEGAANVLGLAPLKTARAQVVLSDGQTAETTPQHIDGVTDWLVYVAPVKPDADTLSADVKLYASDGSLVADVRSVQ